MLTHLASHGLVNEKDRRVIRRLLTRGLIRREPHFVVMNETFRRYLAGRAAECEAQTPPQAGAWENVQRPLLVVGTAVIVVLFVTQQELFGAATAVIGALTTGVASLSKISGLLDKRPGGGGSG